MLRKSFLAISLLLPLTALSATAQAGLTISDQRYWPSEARPAVHSGTSTAHSQPRDAFASSIQPVANMVEGANTRRYHGGPKSPW